MSEAADVLEERQIDAEYKIWKKNAPFLYDSVMTHSLEWPSLTCQWLPTVKKFPKTTEHQFLLGTHTDGSQNYLMKATCHIANPDFELEEKAPRYDEEKKEVGGFGFNGDAGKIEINLKIKHEGEVHRTRYMPQNHFIIASRGPSPEIYIWDLSKHPSTPPENEPATPQGVCVGHEKEGYGLVWSTHQSGLLATASDDKTVRVWDVSCIEKPSTKSGTQITDSTVLKGHTDVVEDVDWHRKDSKMLASVGDDRNLIIWDYSMEKSIVHKVENAHKNNINCVAFSPFNEYVVSTGCADSTVAIWDLRNLTKPTSILEGAHTDEIYMLQWAPHEESILASSASDRRIAVWDLSRIGMEQDPEDAEDGPPELLFIHGGHTARVPDFSWNTNADWTIASVADDNVVQVWQMSEEIYTVDDDEGEGQDGALGDDDLE